MDYKIAEKLNNLGLQPNESKIYLALLELGKGTVTQISQAAQLNRTTGYDVLERLALYGLASRAGSGINKKMYAAEPPIRLKQYLENKKTQAEQRLARADETLSDLLGIYKKDNKPVIKFFEGKEGIKNIYWHTLESKSPIYSILDLSIYLPDYDQFGKEYIRERSQRGIKEKALVIKNQTAIDYYEAVYKHNKHFQKFTEYRWLNKQFPFIPAAEVNIYDDTVMGVLAKSGENAAFEIINPSFANSLKMIFELAWDSTGNKIIPLSSLRVLQ
ncbi:MAG: helix-turn-helix domain-containing protein [Patescibacteria group bacterium]